MSLDRSAWCLLVLLLVVTAGCRDQEDTPAQPAQPAPVVRDLADRCPDPATQIPYPPEGGVPGGAVGVRLCNTRHDFGNLDAPADELRTGVPKLVELVNAAAPAPEDLGCTLEAGPDLVFWFRYADGTARAVRYEQYGCRIFLVGEDRPHVGGEDLHAAFSDQLLAQRELLRPPGASPRPDCAVRKGDPTQAALEVQAGVELERAVICLHVHDEWRQLPELTAEQVKRLQADFHVASFLRYKRCRPSLHTRIVAVTTWGDRINLEGPCWDFQVPAIRRPSGSRSPRYRPSPDVQLMLEQAIAASVR